VAGRWYHPRDERDYRETGVASWYGPGFHGKATANGERFDEHAISAAHRTLPLPSHVEVSNLDNGRTLVVRVNDRGPFAHDRILDLSRRAAQLLGFETRGTARVRVKRVYPGQEPHPVASAVPVVELADALPPDERVTTP
jgi:rare lipoprotein A